MKVRSLILATCVLHAVSTLGHASDNVRRKLGPSVNGSVQRVGNSSVEVKKVSGGIEKIPANQVLTIFYEKQPAVLRMIWTHLQNGRYADALAALNKIELKSVTRTEALQDIEYYKAVCAGRLALNGTGTIREAGSQMALFVKNNANSYHYFDACSLVGELLVALGRREQAEIYYSRVAAAPWPDVRMRADVAVGRIMLAQGKTLDAQLAFDRVLTEKTGGALAEAERLAARTGKAECLIADNKPTEAIRMLEEVLLAADPEQRELNARTYNALGTAQRKTGEPKKAILAFLHVDLLYPSVPDAHAEALANLVALWGAIDKPQRAAIDKKRLEGQYKGSHWADQAGQ